MNIVRWPSHSIFINTALVAWAFPHLGTTIVCAGFAIYGLQHGALDFAKLRYRGRSITRYLFSYFFVMFVFSLIFIKFAGLAVAIFILTSSYHFGSDALLHQSLGHRNLRDVLVACLFGFLLLSIPALGHASDTMHFMSLMSMSTFRNYSPVAPSLLVFLKEASYVAALSVIVIAAAASKRCLFAIEIAALTVSLLVLPLGIGFGLFFVYWHSADALAYQRQALSLTVEAAAKQSFLLTAGAALLLGAFYVMDVRASGSLLHMPLVYMVVGALSVAHILLSPSVKLSDDNLLLLNEQPQPSGSSN